MIIKDLGAVSAYAYAVEKGYTGTEEEFATLMASYASVAEEAAESAESASQSAESASASAQTATTKASEASTSATQASASATSASQSAQTATTKASEASASATQASTKASEASTSATTASSKASEASASATSAQTAQGLAEVARDDAIDAKTDAESARDMAQQYAESIDPENIYSAYPTDTASGSVASFADGADGIPMKSVVVALEPVQDLHGQEAPYPAGGGKNLLYAPSAGTYTENGVTWTLNQDGSITISGTATEASTFRYISNPIGETFDGDYCFICFPTIERNTFVGGVQFNDWFSVYADTPTALNGISGKIQQMWFQVKAGKTLNTTIYPMIYKASEATPTAWSPYSNICPISGWTGAQVSHSGADTTSPTVHSITFPTEAGTVYGGTLDATSGVLTVDRAMVDLGTLTWDSLTSVEYGEYFWGDAHALGIKYEGNYYQTDYNALCSQYSVASRTQALQTNKMLCFDGSVGEVWQIQMKDSDYSDATAFKTAMSGVQLCYQLATPIVYHLTPTEIKSLLGDNNIWADAGDTSVTYRADTAKYIDKKIAEVINALS